MKTRITKFIALTGASGALALAGMGVAQASTGGDDPAGHEAAHHHCHGHHHLMHNHCHGTEPGGNHGGHGTQPGDDHGGHGNEPGDDNGGHGSDD